MPPRLAAFDQSVQQIDNQAGGNPGPWFGAFAHQVGEVAGFRIGVFILGDLARRGWSRDAATLPDQDRCDDTGVRRFGGGKFEDDPLAFFLGRGGGQGVEEGLLFSLAQCRETIERGKCRRGQMSATG